MVPETILDAATASQAFKSALEVVGGVAPEVRDSRLLSEEQWEELRQRLVNQRMLAMELTPAAT